MLRRLLDTVVLLKRPENVSLQVVLIENGPLEYCGAVVRDYRDRLDISAFRQEKTGLVHARNMAVEKGLETGGDWIGFIDDDERMDPMWLEAMLWVMQAYPEARAFAGPVDVIPGEGATRWFAPQKNPNCQTGEVVWSTGAGNILFHRDIYAVSGYRFDPDFNMSGGEDTELFWRLRRDGGKIRWVNEARCEEDALPERAGFRGRFRRTVRVFQNIGYIFRKHHGGFTGRLRAVAWIYKYGFQGLLHLLSGAVILVFSREKGAEQIGMAAFKIAAMAGCIRSLFLSPQAGYETVQGH